MTYYSKEETARARSLDLLTYLRLYEPTNLVHVTGRTYCTREHDSLKISNGKWMWWSRGFGGASALDYLIKVKGMSFQDAMKVLCDEGRNNPSFFNAQKSAHDKKPKEKKLLLPEKNMTHEHVTRYLMSRGIDKGIIEKLIADGYIYESAKYHSCIFLGFDEKKIPRYAAFRSCGSERILGDASGSDKSYPFRIEADSSSIHVFESAIDLLSYATLKKIYGKDWRDETLLSMGGIAVSKTGSLPIPLKRFLKEHREIEEVRIHFDRDRPGRAAAKTLAETLRGDYSVYDKPPPSGKDYNDHLMNVIRKQKLQYQNHTKEEYFHDR